jgi:hypothetical protein
LKKSGPSNPTELDEAQFQKPEIEFPDPSFPVQGSEDLTPDLSPNPACHTLPATAASQGNPIVFCDFIGQEYSEYKDELTKPFQSKGGCELS